MDEQQTPTSHARRPSGRDAKRASRAARAAASIPYITRKIPYYEVLGEEGLSLMEQNADTILEEIGIDFRDDPEALEIWKAAGADVKGERVHFPRGMCRTLVQKTAPRQFTQHARNPARSVLIGGQNTVFAPAYGSPFVRNLDEGRRYARIEDFRNFVKLAYVSGSLHHSGGTICEPVDLPVNKRHLDMVYSHLKFSDKAFMGSVTAPERAEDSVALANIVFGPDLQDPATGRPKTTIINLINVNSPMTYDATMLGAAKVYARANQALIITPFILAGAMSPVTVAGTVAQTLAEALAGLAFVQLVNPGAPRGARQLRFLDLHAVRRTYLRHARAGARALCHGGARPPSGNSVPLRRKSLRLQNPGCSGGIRIRQYPGAHLPRRGQFRAPHCRVAGRRPDHGL